ncbi:MAG: hypothetical protein AB7I33_15040 [Gemmatimonadales bacterium]
MTVSRTVRAVLAALLATTLIDCSDINSDPAVPVVVEVRVPVGPGGGAPQVEIDDTITLAARALNQQGDSIAASFVWRTPDTALVALDSTAGRLSGRQPGTARIQVRTGSLVSGFVNFSVVPHADSLLIVPPDTFRIALADTASAPLIAELDTLNPDGPLANRQLVYELLLPVFGVAGDTATLSGGGLIRTVVTSTTGQPATPVYVRAVPGQPRPDSVLVEVRAVRPSGGPIPGSGQRFTVRFD